MKILVALGAAVAGLAFWRRKSLKQDLETAKTAGQGVVGKVTERLPGRAADESAAEADDAEAAGSEEAAATDAGGDASEAADEPR